MGKIRLPKQQESFLKMVSGMVDSETYSVIKAAVLSQAALEELTPGGSEFYQSPENCFAFVQMRISTLTNFAIEKARFLNEARAQVEKLELSLMKQDLLLDAALKALKVQVLTPHIRAYLEANDPKALEQAKAAIEKSEGIGWEHSIEPTGR